MGFPSCAFVSFVVNGFGIDPSPGGPWDPSLAPLPFTGKLANALVASGACSN
jgi:hypothetical protein